MLFQACVWSLSRCQIINNASLLDGCAHDVRRLCVYGRSFAIYKYNNIPYHVMARRAQVFENLNLIQSV